MNTKEALLSSSNYPIPEGWIEQNATKRGLDLEATITPEVLNSSGYNVVLADCLFTLSLAPNVSQGGQSYSFTADERKAMRQAAKRLYYRAGLDEEAKGCEEEGVTYGYKGDRL